MRTELKPIEALFLAAVEIADPAERAKLLDEKCGNDAELRRKLEALLVAHDRADSLLDEPIVAAAASRPAMMPPQGNGAHPEETSEFSSGLQDGRAEILPFLSPAERADSMGRLGHYEVLEVLGRGGFGIVLKAFDEVLQRVVAVKVLAPALAATSPARKRFLREARSSAAVRHENVVRVHAVEEKPLPHLVMEFVPGETLQDRLDRMGPLDVAEMLSIGRQIAQGLAAAHEIGLIHRDIKPGNILIESGPDLRAKITDFGLARAADDASLTQSGVVAGTPMYMAPEQAKGDPLDHRADLFSLGSVLYVVCTGRPPFRAPGTMAVLKRVCEDPPRPIREIIPEIPLIMAQIVERLHQKNPEDRFPSAKEVAETLARCEAELKTTGGFRDHPVLLTKKPGKKGRLHPRRWGLVSAVALFLIALGYFLLPRYVREPELETRMPGPIDPGLPSNAVAVLPQHSDIVMEPWPTLFNGKDLTGWKAYPESTENNWRVENGVLIGQGKKSFLFYQAKEYENFHFRADFQINASGNSGIIFRSALPKAGDGPDAHGYEAQIVGPQAPASHSETGSLLNFAQTKGIRINEGTWHRIEVIAQGETMAVLINGLVTTKTKDNSRKFVKGHIALQLGEPGTEVRFRNIDIKVPGERAAEAPTAPRTAAEAEFIDSLKEVVAIKNQILDRAKHLIKAGAASHEQLRTAEIELIEAQIVLARAEKKPEQMIDLLQKLVDQREKEHETLTKLAETRAASGLSVIRSRSDLAEARSRLSQAKAARAQENLIKP